MMKVLFFLLLAVACSAQTLDTYGGYTAKPSPNAATPTHWRVEKFGNKWLFVDPANNGFFLVGMYVVDLSSATDDMGSNYTTRILAKYGGADQYQNWAPAQLQRLQSWGFNTTAYPNLYVTPIGTDSNWPGDHTNPVKMPFIGLERPAYYAMVNAGSYGPAPIKNVMYGNSSFYTGFQTGNGVGDYYDPNFDTYWAALLSADMTSVKNSAYGQYMVGIETDDSDQTYGFGNGPDFPATGHSNSQMGWVTLTTSPVQAANSVKGFVYADTTVYSKKALHDQMVTKYGTIGALNTAWGSSYTTFDSSGTQHTAVSLTGSGSGPYTATLSGTVSKFSVQVKVSGVAKAGDTGGGTVWGSTVSVGTINYSTGALSVTFTGTPAATPAVDYMQNGWGTGSGLLDEDGRVSHQGWVGTDYTFMTNVAANLKTDLDTFLFNLASHYFSACKAKIQAFLPGVLYFGPDSLGTWGAPSNRNVLRAAASSIDVMVMGGNPALSQTMLDFIGTYFGDKPFINGEFRTANADSALFRYTDAGGFSTQNLRGLDYKNNVTSYATAAYTSSGSRPYVGVLWWQYTDNWGERLDWGLVSLSDNAYDGHEDVIGSGGTGVRSVTCSAPLAAYLCGGEERNYGDEITSVKAAHTALATALTGGAAPAPPTGLSVFAIH